MTSRIFPIYNIMLHLILHVAEKKACDTGLSPFPLPVLHHFASLVHPSSPVGLWAMWMEVAIVHKNAAQIPQK